MNGLFIIILLLILVLIGLIILIFKLKTKTTASIPNTTKFVPIPSTKPDLQPSTYNQNCFYNAAYEDKDKMDKVDDILNNNVKGCFVLLEPENVNIDKIKKLQNNNDKIGCYMSVGTVEMERPDFNKFKKGVDYVENHMTDWTKEYLIKGEDTSGKPTQNTINLMKQRIDNLANLNCDYIELDNMDADDDEYAKKYNTGLTHNGMKAYTSELCNYMHNHPKRKMKCIYKNENSSDWNQFDALSLESEVDKIPNWNNTFVQSFINSKKPIYISHYGEKDVQGCENTFNKLKQKYGNSFGLACSIYDGKKNSYTHYY